MVNSAILASEICMILVGVAAILWWRKAKKVKWSYFAFGALVWALATVIKYIMDFTITGSVYIGLAMQGVAALLIGLGLYVGLRTGLLESGFSYIAIKSKGLRKIKMNDAVAFGIGMGATEAIVLAMLGFIVASNSAIDQSALNFPAVFVFAPIIERISALAIHVFATLLIFYSVVKNKVSYLIGSIIFKATIDGMVPALGYFFDLSSVAGVYFAEAIIAVAALISLYGIKLLNVKAKK